MKREHKTYFILAAILAAASWIIAAFYWDKLPPVIPTHFGFSGQADGWNNKSAFYVFLVPALQTLMLALFTFVYYKPQYSNIPTTMWLMALDKKERNHAYDLIRTMQTGILMFIGVLFTYMTYAMNVSAMNGISGLSPVIMFTVIGAMLVWLVYWSIRIYRATKLAVKASKKK